jgi:hypothetical protein
MLTNSAASQHAGEVDQREFGGSKMRATATMGKAIGQNAEHPETFLRKHAKEQVLPQRESSRTGITCCHNPSLLMVSLCFSSKEACFISWPAAAACPADMLLHQLQCTVIRAATRMLQQQHKKSCQHQT